MEKVIAAFDFDGTITHRDSLLPFLLFTHGFFKTFLKLFLLSPAFLAYIFGLRSRQMTKEDILTSFFAGMPRGILEKYGTAFATNILHKHVKKKAIERFKWHQEQGHICVIISASIDTYLIPWALHSGFDSALTSKLAYNEQGLVSGSLDGLNCWGSAKVQRLLEWAGPKNGFTLYAYGDSRGDQELLALADHPHFRPF